MTIYYFMIVILTGLGFFLTGRQKEAKTTALYLSVVFICFTLTASLRYAIGFDYFSYQNIYEITAAQPFEDTLQNCWYEPLFFAVCKTCSLFGLPFQALLAVVSSFVCGAAMWFIFHYSSLPWMSVYLYIALQFLAYNMNLMRQSAAVSFFLLAYPYLKDRKPVPYTILIFIGGLFHNSLWFIYPLYFLLPKKLSRKSIGCLLLLTGCVYLFFDPLFSLASPFLPEKYAVYQETYFWNSNSWEYLVLPAVYCLLIFLFQNYIQDPCRRNIYRNSALFYLLINLFITKHFILERFAIYPFIISLAALPDLLASCREDVCQNCRHMKNYHCMVLLFLLFGGIFFLFAAAKGFHHVYPYVSLLNRSRSVPIMDLPAS